MPRSKKNEQINEIPPICEKILNFNTLAINAKDPETKKNIVKEALAYINNKDTCSNETYTAIFRSTLLHLLCKRSVPSLIVLALLSKLKNTNSMEAVTTAVNFKDEDGNIPLDYVFDSLLLLFENSSINTQDLFVAERMKIIDLFLLYNAKPRSSLKRLLFAVRLDLDVYISNLIEDKKDLRNIYSPENFSILYLACCYKSNKVVKLLINEGKVDVNIQNKSENSTLRPIIVCTTIETFRIMMTKSPDLYTPVMNNKELALPIQYFCQYADTETLEAFLNHYDANQINEKIPDDQFERKILHQIVDMDEKPVTDKPKIVELILKKQADVNVKNNLLETPFWLACRRVDIDTMRVLITYGADINASNVDNFTPLMVACFQANCSLECIRLIRGDGTKININEVDNSKQTALYIACTSKSPESLDIVKYLLESGAKLNITTNSGDGPIAVALKKRTDANDLGLLNVLINHDKYAVVFEAFKKGDVGALAMLFEQGALRPDQDAKDNQLCCDLLVTACGNQQREVIKLLLENGVNIALEVDGQALLQVVLKQNNLHLILEHMDIKDLFIIAFHQKLRDVQQWLINNGPTNNRLDLPGTLQTICQEKEKVEIVTVKLLIAKIKESGNDGNDNKYLYKLNNNYGFLPLASAKGQTNIVRELIQDDIDINIGMPPKIDINIGRPPTSHTALHIACKDGNVEIVHALLSSNKIQIEKKMRQG